MLAVSVACYRQGLIFKHGTSLGGTKSIHQSLLQACHKVIPAVRCLSSATRLHPVSQTVVLPGQHVQRPLLSWQLVSSGVTHRLLNQNALPLRPTKHYNDTDGISKDFTLVYKSTINDKIIFFVCFFLGMSVSLSSLYYILAKVLKLVPQGDMMKVPGTGLEIAQLDAAMLSYLFMSMVIVSWFIHKIARLSVVRMYHHESQDTYVGVVKGRALKNVQIEFGPGDIHPIPMRGFLKASNGNVAIHGYPFIVFNADFLIPEYYTRLATHQTVSKDGTVTGSQRRNVGRSQQPAQQAERSAATVDQKQVDQHPEGKEINKMA